MTQNNLRDDVISAMQDMIRDPLNTAYGRPVTFVFNSETGEATANMKYNQLTSNNTIIVDSIISVEEDVGDMLKSNYIILRDRNYPTANGSILGWSEEHPEYSHRISHDCASPLTNLSIIYKNMYL